MTARTALPPTSEQMPDRQTNALQTTVSTLRRAANAQPWQTSYVTPALVFSGATTRTVHHGLGRKPVRWNFEDVTVGPAAIYRVSWDEKTAVFSSTSSCTVVLRLAVD